MDTIAAPATMIAMVRLRRIVPRDRLAGISHQPLKGFKSITFPRS
jgi:hypothetical protein